MSFQIKKNPFRFFSDLYKTSNMVRLFKHEDYNGMVKLVRQQRKKGFRPFIFTDGVYSMDGDIVDLPIVLKTAKQYNAFTAVDEAHALGVIGKTGKGTEEYFGINPEQGADAIMGTLSKSPGVVGGYVAANRKIIQYLRHHASSYMFSTGMPPGMAAACKAAFDIIRTDKERRDNLTKNWQYFKSELLKFEFKHERIQRMNDHLLNKIESAILPVVVGRRYDSYNIVKILQEDGVFVNPVIYPAVRLDASRVRFSLMATHTKNQLDHALHSLSEALYKHDLIKEKRQYA
jgi:7-keto-8-aminopelargonate synthetase-like enzyme